jgi:uncharacterized protein YjbI with pentapeptide repeats
MLSSPSHPTPNAVGQAIQDVGIAVLGGSVVGFAVAIVQRYFDDDRASRAEEDDRKQAMAFTLATQHNLASIDLSGEVLNGRYLAGKVLHHARFGDAQLRGAVLRDADLRDADLTGADLTGADLRGARLERADLTGAILTGVDFVGATLEGCISDSSTVWPAGFRIDPPSVPQP